ncbi:MAG: single-stranded DNA-binding protein [Chloroflexota bacterium]|nr:single-stranded DNA-binding protein [Chloroflexota bacterium]
MASLNKIMLIGNVGQDPELRYTPEGNPVANFSIAVNYRRRVNEELQDETEWFNIVCFTRTAENVNQYLTKGQRVYVEGRFQSREYVGQDGQQRRAYEVVASDVKFLTTKAEAESMGSGDVPNSEPSKSDNSQQQPDQEKEEDLPW